MAVSIKEFDDILEAMHQQGKHAGQAEQVNATMLTAYETSKRYGKEFLDFDNIIWDDDIQPIADTCRELGIKTFTISVRQGSLTQILAKFQELGVEIQGITKIEAHRPDRDGWCEDALLMDVSNTPTPVQLWSEAVNALYLANEAINKAVLSKQQEENPEEQEQNPETQELKAIQAVCSRLISVLETE